MLVPFYGFLILINNFKMDSVEILRSVILEFWRKTSLGKQEIPAVTKKKVTEKKSYL